jgi:hypothetical protein
MAIGRAVRAVVKTECAVDQNCFTSGLPFPQVSQGIFLRRNQHGHPMRAFSSALFQFGASLLQLRCLLPSALGLMPLDHQGRDEQIFLQSAKLEKTYAQ